MTDKNHSAQEKAYRKIRALILSGDFAPGARLRERDISDLVGLSRTPVREALQRLTSEGLVWSERNRGVFVEETDLTEVAEIFDIGMALESRCARLATRKIKQEGIDRLAAAMDDMNALLEQSEENIRRNFVELDKRFHGILIEATENRKLMTLVDQVISIPVLLRAFQDYPAGHFHVSARQHDEVLQAVRSRDAEWAEVAMRNHIMAGRNAIMPGELPA